MLFSLVNAVAFGQSDAEEAAIDAAYRDGRLVTVLDQVSSSVFDFGSANSLVDFVENSDRLMTDQRMKVAFYYGDSRYTVKTGMDLAAAAPVLVATEDYDIIFMYVYRGQDAPVEEEAQIFGSHRLATVHREQLERAYVSRIALMRNAGDDRLPIAQAVESAANALQSVDVRARTDLPKRVHTVMGFKQGTVVLPTAEAYSAAGSYVSDLSDLLAIWNTEALPLFTNDAQASAAVVNLVGAVPEEVRKLEMNSLRYVNGPAYFEEWRFAGSGQQVRAPLSSVTEEVVDELVGDMIVQRGMVEPLIEMVLIGENGGDARSTLKRLSPVKIDTDFSYEYQLTTLATGQVDLGIPILKIFETAASASDLKFRITNTKYPEIRFVGEAVSLGIDVSTGIGFDWEVPSPISGGYYVNADPDDLSRNTDGASSRSLIPPYRLNNMSMEALGFSASAETYSDNATVDNYTLGSMWMFDVSSRQSLVWSCNGLNVMMGYAPSVGSASLDVTGSLGTYRFQIDDYIDIPALTSSLNIPDHPQDRFITSAVIAMPSNNTSPKLLGQVPGANSLLEFLESLVGNQPSHGRTARVEISGYYVGEWNQQQSPASVTNASSLSAAELRTYERFAHLEDYEQQLVELLEDVRWSSNGEPKYSVNATGSSNQSASTVGSYLKRGGLATNGSSAVLLVEIYLEQEQLYDLAEGRTF